MEFMADFTLEEVLIHEFGHWVVAQECDIHPDGVVVRGILWDGSQSTVAEYGAMPFSTTFRHRIEEAVMYAAAWLPNSSRSERSNRAVLWKRWKEIHRTRMTSR